MASSLPNGIGEHIRHRAGVRMKRTARGQSLVMGMLCIVVARVAHTGQALAQGSQQVGLVVKFADGSVFTDCIDYTGPGMTGEDVLDASGLPINKDTSYGLGTAICRIRNDGCSYPSQSCFCKCTGQPPCLYWTYYHLSEQKSEWVYSGMGASWHAVEPGSVEGWAWGDGEYGGSEVEPPVMTFEELCAPPSPPIVDLSAEPEDIVAGQCSTLRWSVENAGVVTLDGEGVRPTDARYVCPTETHTYELQVLNAAGEYSYELTISVTEPTPTPPPTATPARAATATTSRSAAPPPTATRVPQAPAVSPSPTPTVVPSATPTPRASLVAMVPTATPADLHEQPADDSSDKGVSQPTVPITTPEAPPEQSVGLQRILLLLGVGAGTVGFGVIAFVVMLVFLMLIYFRARTHF
jgi:hypothetical protein